MNYILFKADGSLNKQKLDYYIQQSSTGVNTIFVSIADSIDTDVCQAVFTLPNETQNTVQGIAGSLKIEGVTYTGWNITLTSDQTLYNGLLQMSVRIIRGSTQILANYPVALVINETGIMPDTDTGVTIQEINSYLVFLANLQAQIAGSDKYLKVVDDIANINTTTYEGYLNGGDVVYAKDTKYFYLLSGSYPSLTYTQLSFDYVQLKNATSSTTVSDLCGTNAYTLCFIKYNHEIYYFVGIYTGGAYVCIVQKLGGVLKRSGSGVSGSTTFANILTTLEQNDNIDMSTTQNIKGQKTITSGGRIIIDSSGSFNLYNSKITTNAKGYFARVGVTTGQYVDYKLPFGYSDVGAQEYTLATYEQVQDYAYPKTQVYTKSEIDTKLTSMLVYKGSKTVAQLNALVGTLLPENTGYFYNISDSGVLTWTEGGTTQTLEVFAGDNVAWTGSGWDKLTMDLSVYDDKFIAAGFFEVQDYNDNTGEITMVYSSDLYDMSYDGTSGVLTIEAN